jgi:hypothetical protein
MSIMTAMFSLNLETTLIVNETGQLHKSPQPAIEKHLGLDRGVKTAISVESQLIGGEF